MAIRIPWKSVPTKAGAGAKRVKAPLMNNAKIAKAGNAGRGTGKV